MVISFYHSAIFKKIQFKSAESKLRYFCNNKQSEKMLFGIFAERLRSFIC